jgi:hypothetical protein
MPHLRNTLLQVQEHKEMRQQSLVMLLLKVQQQQVLLWQVLQQEL